MKANERLAFRAFNNSTFIKFPIKEAITTSAQKVCLIIQVQLGGIDLPSDQDFNVIRKQYMADKILVFDRIQRLVRCVVECKADDCDAVATRNALELSRSISAGFWENSSLQMRQLDGIGPAAVRKLVSANIKDIESLKALDSADIERIMSRNPPFGIKVLGNVARFPQLSLKLEITKKILKAQSPVRVQVKAEITSLAETLFWKNRPVSVTFFAAVSTGVLGHIWRGPIRKLSKAFEISFVCELSSPTDAITCQVACDDIVGTSQSVILSPNISASEFPANQEPNLMRNTDKPFRRDNDISRITNALGNIVDKTTIEKPDSDYGDDLEGFFDIDDFDFDSQKDNRKEQPQSVQLKNGRWQCNHACRSGKTKKGVPCKHSCCQNGLPKPPKIHPSRFVRNRDEDGNRKTNFSSSKFMLRDSSDPISFDEIEEIDLASDVPDFNNAEFALHGHSQLQDFHNKVQDPNSQHVLEQKSNASYENVGHLNPGILQDHNDQTVFLEDNAQLPSPDKLIGSMEPYDFDAMDASDFFGTPSQYEDATKLPQTTSPEPTETFGNEVFDYSAFLGLKSSSPLQSRSAKRGRSSSADAHEAKRAKAGDARLLEETTMTFDSEQPLPEWTNEISPSLIDFFKGYVDFEP